MDKIARAWPFNRTERARGEIQSEYKIVVGIGQLFIYKHQQQQHRLFTMKKGWILCSNFSMVMFNGIFYDEEFHVSYKKKY